jgi:hypothetical protein
MDTIWELLKPIAGGIWRYFSTVFERLITEPGYRAGFGDCFVVIGVCVVFSSAFSWAWAKIQKFFSATKAPPAPGAGPTPVGLMGGCVQGAIVLLLFAVVAVFLLLRSVLP